VKAFHLPPEVIIRSFVHLKVVPLRADGVYEVHYVHPGEQIGFRIRRVRQGTPVFALPDGTPLLVQVCGNPLRHGPLDVLANYGAHTGRLSTVPDFDPLEGPDELASNVGPVVAGMRIAAPVEDLPTVSVLQPETDLGPLSSGATGSPSVPPLTRAGALSSWSKVGALGALGGLLFGGGGGQIDSRHSPNGGGGGKTPPLGPLDHNSDTPEPGTGICAVAILLTGWFYGRTAMANRRRAAVRPAPLPSA
jgi:hypothetical protein